MLTHQPSNKPFANAALQALSFVLESREAPLGSIQSTATPPTPKEDKHGLAILSDISVQSSILTSQRWA
jgi:hypothetical protein